MTTSGTTVFNFNRNQIIYAALRKLGAIASGETPDQQTVQDCADQLNSMVKAWVAAGIHIWTTVEAVLFVQQGQIQYNIGSGTTNTVVAQIYTNTELTNVAPLGSTSIVVALATNAAIGGQIGVTLNSGFIFWTTIQSVSGLNIGIASPLTDSAAALLPVYIASPNIDRPLRIPSVRRWQSQSLIETPLIPLSRLDYQWLPNKNVRGDVTQYYYNPQGGAVNVGALFLWPAPVDTLNNNIKFTYNRILQDFNIAADTPDFPQEWIDTLVWNLARKMAPEYDCPTSRYQIIVTEAAATLELVQGWDREPESALFGINMDQIGYSPS